MKRLKKKIKNKNRPPTTTKHGKLKTDRKSKHEAILVEDLATLENLSESVIVDQLNKRFNLGFIYTYIGDILIALNPFKKLGIYGEDVSCWLIIARPRASYFIILSMQCCIVTSPSQRTLHMSLPLPMQHTTPCCTRSWINVWSFRENRGLERRKARTYFSNIWLGSGRHRINTWRKKYFK